jgi:hypothetical protein
MHVRRPVRAGAKEISPSHPYVSWVLRLTLLAPAIVDAILVALHPSAMTLALLMRPFPVEWDVQQMAKGLHQGTPRSEALSRFA